MFERQTIRTQKQEEFREITRLVQERVEKFTTQTGQILVYVPHTTAGVTINENADPDVVQDILRALTNLIPQKGPYRHQEGNSPGHIKASLMGSSVTLPVWEGRLQLGRWQGIFLCEFDGPRKREVLFQVMDHA